MPRLRCTISFHHAAAKPADRRLRSQRRARLSVEPLEDRRLLAAIDTFVFVDIDSSKDFMAAVDQPAASRFLYVDADSNGAFDPGEPFGVSDLDGLATIDVSTVALPAGGALDLRTFEGDATAEVLWDGHAEAVPAMLAVPADDASGAAPQWSVDRLTRSIDEDEALQNLSDEIRAALTGGADTAADIFVVTPPTLGRIAVDQLGRHVYVPDANANGTDSFLVAARVGKSWSTPLPLDISIAPIDDPPTQIQVEFVAGVPENEANALIATYVVEDIDGGELVISLSPSESISAANGEVRLRAGHQLNFEVGEEFAVSIGFSSGGESLLDVPKVLSVEDRDDPSEGISFLGSTEVEEFRTGYRFGQISVVDEDRDEAFSWELSDDRFTVDEENSLRLKPSECLMTRDGLSVPLVLTAHGSKGGQPVSTSLTIDVLYAPPSFQNSAWPVDVNDDGAVTPLDVLTVINALNSTGVRSLDGPPPEEEYNYIDVNGDRVLTPLDVLIVINYLNSQRRGGGNAGGESPDAKPSDSGSSNQLNFAAVDSPTAGAPELPDSLVSASGEDHAASSPASPLGVDAVDFYWSGLDQSDPFNRRR